MSTAETSRQAQERGNLAHTLYDAAFQTRQYTHGAEMQRPRKIPIRVEPKTWFANERTFLAWTGIAVTFGTTSTVLSTILTGDQARKSGFTERSASFIGLLLAPLSICVLLYALFTYRSRVTFLEKKEIGFFDDRIGPITMTALIMSTLLCITFLAYWDFFHR